MSPERPNDLPPRLIPGWPVLVLLAADAGAIYWLQRLDGLGDGGMNNALTYVAVLLGAATFWLWFLLRSGQSKRVRGIALVAGVGGLVAAVTAVRVESWNGAMIPNLRWAWNGPRDSQLPTAILGGSSEIDLSVTSDRDFPGFLGRARTGVVPEVTLARDWSATPPQLLWRVPCGSGWSGFAVVNEVAITIEQRRGQQVVVARSMEDGADLWRYARVGSYHSSLAGDGPRSTPLVHDGLVYTHDVLGRLACLDGRDGSVLWEHDLRAMYGMTDDLESKLIGFGRSPSPLVHDGRIIIAAGGDPDGKSAGIVAFEARTGELLWEGPPRQLSHASPNVVTLAGRTQIVVTNEDTVSGHAPDTGELLWEHPWPGKTGGDANNSQPTPVGDDRVLISKGYGQGSALLRLVPTEDGGLSVETVWASRRSLRTKFTNPVVHGEHAYALSDGILECVSLENGERVWRDGRYGHGQVLLVGQEAVEEVAASRVVPTDRLARRRPPRMVAPFVGFDNAARRFVGAARGVATSSTASQGASAVLVVLTEEGELLMVEPRPDAENVVLGKLEVLSDKTWNTFALYGDRIVVRNAVEAACYRLPVEGE